MKNIISLLLIAASAFLLFSCQENEEDLKKKELEIKSLRYFGRVNLERDQLAEAEAAYLRLVDLAPSDGSAYANLALVYLKENKYDKAQTCIKKALRKDPDNLDIRMISARYFELTKQPDKAIGELEEILEKNPDHAMATYNLAKIYEQYEGQDAQANHEKYLKLTMEHAPANIVPRLELIALLLKKGEFDGATYQLEELPKIFPEFPKEVAGFYKETMAALHASDTAAVSGGFSMFQKFLKVTLNYQSDLGDLNGPDGSVVGLFVVSLSDFDLTYAEKGESIINRIRFLNISSSMGLKSFGQTAPPTDDVSSHFTLGDYNDDGYVDIYFSSFSPGDSSSVKRLLKNQYGSIFQEQTREAGISHSGRETASLFGDFNNDGYFDLYIVKDGSNVLYKNIGNGAFSNVSAEAKVDDPEAGHKAISFDADQDGDLDLLVTRPTSNLLYRNNSDGTFTEMANEMGLGAPTANCGEVAFADFDEDGDLDLLMTNDKTPNLLFSNERHSKFKAVITESGLQDSNPAVAVAVADYNNDGFSDLLSLSKSLGMSGLYANRGDGTFTLEPATWLKSIQNITPLDGAFIDFDNDGYLDLMIVGKPMAKGGRGAFLFHNDSKGNFDDVSNLLPSSVVSGQQIEISDYDKDGDLDVFIADLNGNLDLWQNEGGNLNRHLTVQLVGLRDGNNKNNHFGIGAKVEIRVGELYQMKVVTEPTIHFGLGSRVKADALRITWTNGVAQNKFFPGTDQEVIELNSLKGSCAFLYTWDGERYVFSKDMMWRSALGMPLGIMGSGKTAYAPSVPSKEYLKIPGEQMKLQDGKYTIQITEELWEAAYFDKLELVAVDHPMTEEVYVDERFTMPPYSDKYELFAVQKKLLPLSAVDGFGTDILPQIMEKDDRYITNFQAGEYQGITELHDLVLDPGDNLSSGNFLIFLNGWIFPSDASINVALGQSSKLKVIPPQLQVVNKNGEWETVIPNMGFPMGKDKMVIVDLSGQFLSKDRRVRIRTNMEIYWDEIFFAPKANPKELAATRLKPSRTDLHYRGFSELYRKGGRYGPHWFDYYQVTTGQKWRDLIGNYTRFGEVTPLLTAADDRLLIMNSGDEVTVSFDPRNLPPLPNGWKRDFLIYSEGWIKDGDLNTAHGKTVAPLPFHAMTRYPYGEEQSFPSDAEHREYLKNYNTRKVNTVEFSRELLDVQ